MKKISLTLVIFTMICTNLNAQNDVLSAFLLKWENSKNYLIEVAEAMPENSYNYKPTERQMSFQEQSNLYLRLKRLLDIKLMGNLFKVIFTYKFKKDSFLGFE